LGFFNSMMAGKKKSIIIIAIAADKDVSVFGI